MEQSKQKKEWLVRLTTLFLLLALAVSVIVLSVYLAFSNDKVSSYGTTIENVYRKCYYELIGDLNEIETNLVKLSITTSSGQQIKLLQNVVKNSETAEASFSELALNNHSGENVSRYLNQTGGYCSMLVAKLSASESLNNENRDQLSTLAKNIRELTVALNSAGASLMTGLGFSDTDGFWGNVLDELNQNASEYPSLIYDGPFSDALDNREPKALTGEDINEEKGKAIVQNILSGYSVKSIDFCGTSENKFTVLDYDVNIEGERTAFVQISQKGGHLVSFNIYRSVTDPLLSPEECVQKAEAFAENAGYKNMKAVWTSNSHSTVYVNLVPIENEVIYYSDMVKVKVAADNGEILGAESLSYLYNHCERTLAKPTLSASEAAAKSFEDFTVTDTKLALIPTAGGKEKLTYQLHGHYNGETFYLYIDVESGEEIEIYRVIESDQGEMLM